MKNVARLLKVLLSRGKQAAEAGGAGHGRQQCCVSRRGHWLPATAGLHLRALTREQLKNVN